MTLMLPHLMSLLHRVSVRAVVTCVMGGIYMLKKFSLKQVRKKAKNWPCVSATIEHIRSRMLDQDEGKGWVGELAYSYCVNGEYYSGFHHFIAKSEVDAERQIANWKDRKITVHFKQGQPEISILLIEEQQQKPFTVRMPIGWLAPGNQLR